MCIKKKGCDNICRCKYQYHSWYLKRSTIKEIEKQIRVYLSNYPSITKAYAHSLALGLCNNLYPLSKPRSYNHLYFRIIKTSIEPTIDLLKEINSIPDISLLQGYADRLSIIYEKYQYNQNQQNLQKLLFIFLDDIWAEMNVSKPETLEIEIDFKLKIKVKYRQYIMLLQNILKKNKTNKTLF